MSAGSSFNYAHICTLPDDRLHASITPVVLCIIFLLAIIPCQLFHAFRFHTLSKDKAILSCSQREPKLIRISNCLMIIGSAIYHPCYIIINISTICETHPHLIEVISLSFAYIYGLVMYGSILLLIGRYWLICHKLNCCNCLANNHWKYLLNPSLENKPSFWVKHKQTLGSTKCILKIILVSWLILYIIWCILITLYYQHKCLKILETIVGVHVLVLVVFMLIFNKITPQILEDVMYLKYEIKTFLLYYLISVPILSLFYLVNGYGYIQYWSRVVITFILTISNATRTLIPTYWIVRKINHIKNDSTKISKKRHRIVSNKDNSKITSKFTKNRGGSTMGRGRGRDTAYKKVMSRSHDDTSKGLIYTLNDEESIQLFIQHLSRGFRVELIICFIEMTQYKDLVLNICNIDQDLDEKVDSDQDGNGGDYEMKQTANDQTNDDIHQNHPKLNLLNVSPRAINRQQTSSSPDLTRMDYNFDECDFKTNTAIPRSSIVHRQDYIENSVNIGGDGDIVNNYGYNEDGMVIENNKRRLLTIIYKLFHRYINGYDHETMEMMINIEYYTRNIYMAHIGKKTLNEFVEANKNISERKLFRYFDDVLIEIWRLLQDEYDKFENIERRASLSMILAIDGMEDDDFTGDDNDVSDHETELNIIKSF